MVRSGICAFNLMGESVDEEKKDVLRHIHLALPFQRSMEKGARMERPIINSMRFRYMRGQLLATDWPWICLPPLESI